MKMDIPSPRAEHPHAPSPSGAAATASGKVPWVLVLSLMAIYAYAFVDRVILALLVEPIRADLHIGDVQMSLLLGLAFAGFYAVLNLPAGYLVDKLNRRMVIGVASLVWASMTICCGLAHDFTGLFLARAGVGLAEAVISPAAFSLIRDATPPKSRGAAFSVYAMAPMIGGALALGVGGALLHTAKTGGFVGLPLLGVLTPWRAVLVLVGACGLPLSLVLLLFREPARAGAADAADGVGRVGGIGEAWTHMRRHGGVYLALIGFVTFGAMMSFGQSAWLPSLFGRRFHLAPDRVGPMLGPIVLACGLSGLTFSAWVTTRIERRGGDIRLFGAIAGLGTGLGLAGAALAPGLGASLASAAVGLFFVGASFPIGAATLSQIAPTEVMGKVTGVYLLFQTLAGQALGPMLIALGAEKAFGGGRTGLPPAFALAMLVFAVATVICAMTLRRGMRRRGAAAVTAAIQA